MVFLLLFIAEEGQQHLWLQAPSLFRPCAEPGRLYSPSAQGISAQRSQTLPLSAFNWDTLTPQLWPVYIMVCFSSMESIYLILQRDSIWKGFLYPCCVRSWRAWSLSSQWPSPRGAFFQFIFVLSRLSHGKSSMSFDSLLLLGHGSVRAEAWGWEINLHKVRRVLPVELGFYILLQGIWDLLWL